MTARRSSCESTSSAATSLRVFKHGNVNDDDEELRDDLAALQQLLLIAGGNRFQLNYWLNREVPAVYADALATLGTFFPGEGAKFKRGRSPECDANAAMLDNGTTWRRFSGFALSEDGCWRLHSWVMTPDGIVETTEPRVLYFGIRRPV